MTKLHIQNNISQDSSQSIIDLSINALPMTWEAIHNILPGESFKKMAKRIGNWSLEISVMSEVRENQFDFLNLMTYVAYDKTIVNPNPFYELFKLLDDSEMKRMTSYLFKEKFIELPRPKKIEILNHVVDILSPGIYSYDDIALKLSDELKKNGHEIKVRSLKALIDRCTKGIYFFGKGLYVKVDESIYENSSMWESLFDLTEELLQEKAIISTRLLRFAFSNIFPKSGPEASSEYAIHAMMKNKYKDKFIDFARTPILTSRLNETATIDEFWKFILIELTKEGISNLDGLLSGLQTKYGFNEAYSRNLINEFGSETKRKIDKQLFKITKNKEIKWI